MWRAWLMGIVYGAIGMFAWSASADPQFYTDEAAWVAAVGGASRVETFATTPGNILKADEVTTLPGDNTDLGTRTLTFPSSATALSWGFRLSDLDPSSSARWWFNTPGTPITNFLEPAGGADDNWGMDVLSGPSLHAFAFDLGDNGNFPAITDTYYVYGADGLLGSVTAPQMPPYVRFLGVVSEVPITRVFYDEDTSDDNIVLANFRFAAVVPEPFSIAFMGCAFAGVLAARSRRRAAEKRQ